MPEDERPAASVAPPTPYNALDPGLLGGVGKAPAPVLDPQQKGRTRRWIDRSRRWTIAERSRVDSALQERRHRSPIVAAGFDIQDLDARVGGGILAGAVAFRLFLFLVPFVYVIFTVLGLAAKTANEDPAHLAKTIGITGVLASAVVCTQSQSAWTQLFLVLGATVALFVTASSLTKALYVVHWLVWRIPRLRPSGLFPRLTVIGVALAMTALGVALNDLRRSSGAPVAVLTVLLVTATSFALWWWTSWRLPHAPTPAWALIPGAVFMAIGIDVLHLLTTYWIGHLVARKSHTYGAVGIALAVLLWVYILGRIIVGSAGLNATLWHRHEDRVTASDAAGGRSSPRNPVM